MGFAVGASAARRRPFWKQTMVLPVENGRWRCGAADDWRPDDDDDWHGGDNRLAGFRPRFRCCHRVSIRRSQRPARGNVDGEEAAAVARSSWRRRHPPWRRRRPSATNVSRSITSPLAEFPFTAPHTFATPRQRTGRCLGTACRGLQESSVSMTTSCDVAIVFVTNSNHQCEPWRFFDTGDACVCVCVCVCVSVSISNERIERWTDRSWAFYFLFGIELWILALEVLVKRSAD